MQVTIEPRAGYLKVIVRRRESVEDNRSITSTIIEAAKAHERDRLLLVGEQSDPIYRVHQYDLEGWFRQLRELGVRRVALVSDSAELFASHQYIELIAAQRGAPLRAFRDEKRALGWLLGEEGRGG